MRGFSRITSYNVCYTKLLRREGGGQSERHELFTEERYRHDTAEDRHQVNEETGAVGADQFNAAVETEV